MKPLFVSVILLFAATWTLAQAQKTPDSKYDSYFAIGTALVNDSLDQTKQAVQSLKKDLANSKNSPEMDKAIAEIADARDLKAAREAYSGLTEALKKAKVQGVEYYCSMVKKNWLQKDSSKVQNPYLGKGMASCGEKKVPDKN